MAGHSYDWPYLGHTVVRPLHVGGGDDDDNTCCTEYPCCTIILTGGAWRLQSSCIWMLIWMPYIWMLYMLFEHNFVLKSNIMEHGGPFVLAPNNVEMRPTFPISWRRDKSQFTGAHAYWKLHFGLNNERWIPFEREIWSKLERPFLERDSDKVAELSAVTLRNVEAYCRSFYGYLVNVRGMGVRQATDVRHLLDPWLLNAYWVFMATPKSKGGRGSARDTMRLMCNSIMHMLISCRVLGLRGLEPGAPTPRLLLKWWKKTAQPLCRRCPIGPRKGKARGDGKLWPRFQVRQAIARHAVYTASHSHGGMYVRLAVSICGQYYSGP